MISWCDRADHTATYSDTKGRGDTAELASGGLHLTGKNCRRHEVSAGYHVECPQHLLTIDDTLLARTDLFRDLLVRQIVLALCGGKCGASRIWGGHDERVREFGAKEGGW